KVLLGGIASIALFVGGIGIMNIMLVSVTERTREIGLRKAVGAKQLDILFQFLIESVVMSLIGGAIGIMVGAFIGMGAAAAITTFLIKEVEWPAVVSITAAIAAVSTSAFIGICSGIYPAYKAAVLMPTEALRHE
ncbi:TPA: FtsX-like permease family protein, partial [Candidatus Poribacteria bacterium]|nr:FtsX-like permease family protein [Candidatus Poribacteria bacterium]